MYILRMPAWHWTIQWLDRLYQFHGTLRSATHSTRLCLGSRACLSNEQNYDGHNFQSIRCNYRTTISTTLYPKASTGGSLMIEIAHTQRYPDHRRRPFHQSKLNRPWLVPNNPKIMYETCRSCIAWMPNKHKTSKLCLEFTACEINAALHQSVLSWYDVVLNHIEPL